MKLFQVLIALFILTVSASVYAMGIYLQPISLTQHHPPPAIKLNPVHSLAPAQKESPAARKIQALMDQQRFRRLLASSS